MHEKHKFYLITSNHIIKDPEEGVFIFGWESLDKAILGFANNIISLDKGYMGLWAKLPMNRYREIARIII